MKQLIQVSAVFLFMHGLSDRMMRFICSKECSGNTPEYPSYGQTTGKISMTISTNSMSHLLCFVVPVIR